MNDETQIAVFKEDTNIVASQADCFIKTMYPGYCVTPNDFNKLIESNSSVRLDSMAFFRLSSCTVEKSDDVFRTVNEKMEKLLAALHSVNVTFGFGVISSQGISNLVLCVDNEKSKIVERIINGMLSGIEFTGFKPDFNTMKKPASFGLLSGVPTVSIESEKQSFSLSSVMRALNGSDYTILFYASPVKSEVVQDKINELISIRDAAFAVSKRNIANSESVSDGTSKSKTVTDTKTNSDSFGGGIGVVIPVGPVFLSPNASYSHSYSRSHSEGFTDTITKTIAEGKSISAEIQNGFALELINLADKAIERMNGCRNNGVWQTALCYSADSEISRNIIKACLCSELSKPVSDKLPMVSFEAEESDPKYSGQQLLIPKFNDNNPNQLCSLINSSELGLLCTPPVESVPDFEMRQAKQMPLIRNDCGGIEVGKVCDGERAIDNMTFSFSHNDLNKHTFVCGITGSGKTTTVKKILSSANKPFLVIEPAKTEYRNLKVKKTVYTLGKPELNCPKINPFYIMPGVSPQAHIDFLKDLFVASFSFYGPMPYILEKCLHNIYKKRGWDLTLGLHPLLTNVKHLDRMYDKSYIQQQYSKISHKYLFPTMQDLKDEIQRYISEEMDYDGEVSGNIKTAIKTRLENLCVGTKGYMFNTHECINMKELMSENVVLEMEGLADDADKAFGVGLILVLINEYRQTQGKKSNLDHLLVIEEAHRLLKNVGTERTSEDMGNPKGKAVEHFTNIIAEMRSYGQGVIVAEQIPSKLAPDVIKNTSNKIVHRIVSIDDQEIISNTIGMYAEDALQLGTIKTGYALCHKEGMMLPTRVKVEYAPDVQITDEQLFLNKIQQNMPDILYSKLEETLGDVSKCKEIAIRLLNTIMVEDANVAIQSIKSACKQIKKIIKLRNTDIAFKGELLDYVPKFVACTITKLLVCGVYSAYHLPDNSFCESLTNLINTPDEVYFEATRKLLQDLFKEDISEVVYKIVLWSIMIKYNEGVDIEKSIKAFFIDVSSKTIEHIINYEEDC